MKIKSYKMIIIPFEYVPPRVVFRYKNDWWQRCIGSESQAEKFEENPTGHREHIFPKELVATGKSSLERNIQEVHIYEEFDLNTK